MMLNPLNQKQQQKVDRAFEISIACWLGSMLVTFLLALLSIYLTRKYSPNFSLSPLIYTVVFFTACLFLGAAKFFYEAFMDKKKIQSLDLDTYLAHYVLIHIVLFCLVNLSSVLGGIYAFLSGEEKKLGFFLVISFTGLILFLPRKNDLLIRYLYRKQA